MDSRRRGNDSAIRIRKKIETDPLLVETARRLFLMEWCINELPGFSIDVGSGMAMPHRTRRPSHLLACGKWASRNNTEAIPALMFFQSG
jgi:hypothetical protein